MKKNKFWNQKEIDFLKENYPAYGKSFCATKLKKSENSIRKKVEQLKLKRVVKNSKYEINSFSKAVLSAKSYTEVARILGLGTTYGNRETVKKYIEKYRLDISHFDFGVSNHKKLVGRVDLSEILTINSSYLHTTNLKNRLYAEGLKKRKCEECNQDENWRGKKMSLILDHINGINNDNRIENLRILCPNCNATLETHGGKNIKK